MPEQRVASTPPMSHGGQTYSTANMENLLSQKVDALGMSKCGGYDFAISPERDCPGEPTNILRMASQIQQALRRFYMDRLNTLQKHFHQESLR